MMHKVRMIGADLDGTLLTTDKRLTDYTKDVLKRVMKAGVIVLPATGRPVSGLPKELVEFPGIRYAVTSNGGRVVDLQERKTLFASLLFAETAREILGIFEQYDTLREIYYDGIGYAQAKELANAGRYHDCPMAAYVTATRVSVPDIRRKFEEENRDVDKIQAVFASVKERNEVLKRLEKIPDIEVTASLAKNIEVNASGVNKGRALVELGKLLAVPREEILAFGDGTNDLHMVKEAGIGVAMSNGVESVRAAADDVTGSNDEDGVARYINDYVLS